jgi:hypothetical protein
MASTVRGRSVVSHKEGTGLVNAMQCTVLSHSTAIVFINDDAGLWAACTTAPAKLAYGKPLS